LPVPIFRAANAGSQEIERHELTVIDSSPETITEPKPAPVPGFTSGRDAQRIRARGRRIRAYLNSLAYPLLVLGFTTSVNLITGVRGWFLEIATIVSCSYHVRNTQPKGQSLTGYTHIESGCEISHPREAAESEK
jgi:hypothetical protein